MKKKITVALSVLLLILSTLGLVSCSVGKYEEQNLVIRSWHGSDQDKKGHDFGRYNISVSVSDSSDFVSFYPKNKEEFLKDILAKNHLFKKLSYESKRDAYIFLEDGDYYLLTKNSDDKKDKEYTLGTLTSGFIDSLGRGYNFPLCEISSDDNLRLFSFTQENLTRETVNDWQFFVDFYSNIDQKYCKVDKENKTILTKAFWYGKGILSADYLIKITYKEEGGKRTLTAEKLDGSVLPY